MKTGIIYLIGRAGTGKYTIAQEISKSGYIICDNQLINNPIFTLINYDGTQSTPLPKFVWDSIYTVRQGVFKFLRAEKTSSYVMTNVLYEDSGDRSLFYQMEEVAEARGGFFAPIKLLISEEENKKRIQNPNRQLRLKSINAIHTTENELINISHPNLLELDVTNLSAADAAQRILEHAATISK